MTGPRDASADARWYRVADPTVPPRQAEAEAVAEGHPLPIGDPDPAGLQRRRWRLSVALLWIAWRDEGRVAAELPRLAFWRERMRYEGGEGQIMALDAAERELGDALAALPGLAAVGVPPGGAGSGAVPPAAWAGLMFGPLGEDRAVLAGWDEPRWESVTISADAMRKEWPTRTAVEAASTIKAPMPVPIQAAKTSGAKRSRKPDVIAAALLERFPAEPAGLSRPQMAEKIKGDVGFGISSSTLKRAIEIAKITWSRPGQTGSKKV